MVAHLHMLAFFGNSILLRFKFTYAKHELCHWARLPATRLCILSQNKEFRGWGCGSAARALIQHKALSSIPNTA